MKEGVVEKLRKGIKVNRFYQTSVKNIYAVGNIIGEIMLVHVTEEEGKHVVVNIYIEIKNKTNNKNNKIIGAHIIGP